MKSETFLLSLDFSVLFNPSHPEKKVSETVQQHIEEIWKKEIVRTRGKVFNGRFLSADHFDGKYLQGHFVDYKYYLAQTRDPTLAQELNIKPVCVCSYTVCDDCILMGKRADYVTEYQNFYELVPAGGIDPSAISGSSIDIIKQIKLELKEEAGIDASYVQSIIPTFLINYPGNMPYEICVKIELNPAVKNLQAERDDEYTELIWIHKDKMDEFVKQNHENIIPLSILILSLFNPRKSK